MSLLNEIQDVGIGQALRRRLGILSTGSPAPALAPEIMPVVSLGDDRPDLRYLANERLAGATAGQAAVAAQFSFVGLTNPTNSNLVVVVERIRVVAPAGSSIRVVMRQAVLTGTPTLGAVRDGRWAPSLTQQAVAVCNLTGGTLGGLPAELSQCVVEAGVTQEIEVPFIIRPGETLAAVAAVANITIGAVTFFWSERRANQDELR